MKKLILALIISVLATASLQAQTYIVTTPKIPDSLRLEKTLVAISFENISQLERRLNNEIRKAYLESDTIACESSMNLYLQSQWNKYYLFEQSFQTELDSIIILKVGDNYYENGDITKPPLNLEKSNLDAMKSRYLEKYGDEKLIKAYIPNYRTKKERLEQLNDWLTQIQSQ